jgi:retron-type reverse transcriptase
LDIRYKNLTYVLKRILKASIQLKNGAIITLDKETLQSNIISPLLANVVLNELNWCIDG